MNERIRVIQRHLAPGRTTPRYCTACGAATREGKEFCPEHVLMNTYAKVAAERDREFRLELANASTASYRKINPDGPVAREILNSLLVNGPRTLERLSEEVVYADINAVHAFVRKLQDVGQVSLSTTRRGHLMIRLADPLATTQALRGDSLTKVAS